jgi:hypothetical protein
MSKKDSRQLQYIMFASYSLKLADSRLIIKNMRLITSLTIIKTGKHIGFYKTSEWQIVKSTESISASSKEIISYISKHKKTEFESLKIKLQEELRLLELSLCLSKDNAKRSSCVLY